MNNVVVTGGLGFSGQHLIKELEKQGKKVFCFDRKLGHELLDYEHLRNFLDISRPTEIYHLAAQAYIPESFESPIRTFEQNTLGSITLLRAIRNLGIKTKILLVGTSEEITSPYAISKTAMEQMGMLYADKYGMDVVVVKPSNHTGPGKGEMYAESSWAKQIVAIERGEQDILYHGNLESRKNFTDVRDIAKAYIQAIKLKPGIYHICSDKDVTMQEVMDILVKNSKVKIKTEVNPAFFRKTDDFKGLKCDLPGWKPTWSLEDSLSSLLQYWRSQ